LNEKIRLNLRISIIQHTIEGSL